MQLEELWLADKVSVRSKCTCVDIKIQRGIVRTSFNETRFSKVSPFNLNAWETFLFIRSTYLGTCVALKEADPGSCCFLRVEQINSLPKPQFPQKPFLQLFLASRLLGGGRRDDFLLSRYQCQMLSKVEKTHRKRGSRLLSLDGC